MNSFNKYNRFNGNILPTEKQTCKYLHGNLWHSHIKLKTKDVKNHIPKKVEGDYKFLALQSEPNKFLFVIKLCTQSSLEEQEVVSASVNATFLLFISSSCWETRKFGAELKIANFYWPQIYLHTPEEQTHMGKWWNRKRLNKRTMRIV